MSNCLCRCKYLTFIHNVSLTCHVFFFHYLRGGHVKGKCRPPPNVRWVRRLGTLSTQPPVPNAVSSLLIERSEAKAYTFAVSALSFCGSPLPVSINVTFYVFKLFPPSTEFIYVLFVVYMGDEGVGG